MPRGERRLPAACVARLRSADLIIHAGDLVRASVLRELQGLGVVAAVHGNVDDASVRQMLPLIRTIEADGAQIGLLHDAGPATGRLQRLRRRFTTADAAVFGHSHIPLHERSPDGFQIFNPGSPTERRLAPSHTMGIAEVRSGVISFELVELD
jgi:hypothetical protein